MPKSIITRGLNQASSESSFQMPRSEGHYHLEGKICSPAWPVQAGARSFRNISYNGCRDGAACQLGLCGFTDPVLPRGGSRLPYDLLLCWRGRKTLLNQPAAGRVLPYYPEYLISLTGYEVDIA